MATKGTWEYTYDAYGNLVKAHDTASGGITVQYWRDALNNRAAKDVGGTKTLFFNFGVDQLESYDISTSSSSSTIYEPGFNRPLAEIDSSGGITFYHADCLRSIILLTSGSGAVIEQYSYDAWGKPSAIGPTFIPVALAAIKSKFLFTGQEFDRETALCHYRARAYDPQLGRFLQDDPIDCGGKDSNLLRYVFNNSVNFIDPSGMQEAECDKSLLDPEEDDDDIEKIIEFERDLLKDSALEIALKAQEDISGIELGLLSEGATEASLPFLELFTALAQLGPGLTDTTPKILSNDQTKDFLMNQKFNDGSDMHRSWQ